VTLTRSRGQSRDSNEASNVLAAVHRDLDGPIGICVDNFVALPGDELKENIGEARAEGKASEYSHKHGATAHVLESTPR
jgi:hypothetical protein